MPTPGRPRLLDETKRREICALISAGDDLRGAARYVGCSVRTIRREAARNDSFDEQLRRAETAARLEPLRRMRQAAHSHWRAAAWLLERTDPERFGRRRPHAFGKQELRALARDLLAIVREEVVDPLPLERIEGRVQATVNYAMRHAWDQRRSGGELRRAMESFDRKTTHDDWLGRCDRPSQQRDAEPSDHETMETPPADQHDASDPSAEDQAAQEDANRLAADLLQFCAAQDREQEADVGCVPRSATHHQPVGDDGSSGPEDDDPDAPPMTRQEFAAALRSQLTQLAEGLQAERARSAANAERDDPPKHGQAHSIGAENRVLQT